MKKGTKLISRGFGPYNFAELLEDVKETQQIVLVKISGPVKGIYRETEVSLTVEHLNQWFKIDP